MKDLRHRRRKRPRSTEITGPTHSVFHGRKPEDIEWINMIADDTINKKGYSLSMLHMYLLEAYARNEGLKPRPGGPEVN